MFTLTSSINIKKKEISCFSASPTKQIPLVLYEYSVLNKHPSFVSPAVFQTLFVPAQFFTLHNPSTSEKHLPLVAFLQFPFSSTRVATRSPYVQPVGIPGTS